MLFNNAAAFNRKSKKMFFKNLVNFKNKKLVKNIDYEQNYSSGSET